jgi:glutamate racemase
MVLDHLTAPPADKEAVTILVTDSGLGGMAIFSEIAARLISDPIFSSVSLVYYNAWPVQDHGYNRLKDMEERVRAFDAALNGMLRFQPDIIMLACNTLSILYPRTEFSHKQTLPVIDILEFGVNMLYEALMEKHRAQAVLLGTVTTIASGVHHARLMEKGIDPNRLVSQPCDQLATQIEKGPGSEQVAEMIDTYMRQAADKMSASPAEIFAALFCTHFGFSEKLIRQKLEALLRKPVIILDPNLRMAAFLFDACNRRYESTQVTLRVVSRIAWDSPKIEAVSNIIEKRSFESARALKTYEWIPDLFEFRVRNSDFSSV